MIVFFSDILITIDDKKDLHPIEKFGTFPSKRVGIVGCPFRMCILGTPTRRFLHKYMLEIDEEFIYQAGIVQISFNLNQ